MGLLLSCIGAQIVAPKASREVTGITAIDSRKALTVARALKGELIRADRFATPMGTGVIMNIPAGNGIRIGARDHDDDRDR
jgi:hypothetical protein